MSCHSNVSTMTHLRTYLVRRLDGVDQDYQVDKKANGSDLLDRACKSLGILEKDYFGLQYKDKNGDHLWINLRNPLQEQLPQNSLRPTVEMRVKYFVAPQKLIQPITRIHFYKHLRKELILGRLKVNSAKGARLTALMAQIDKGDYHSNFQYRHKVPCSSSEMENYETRIRREHYKLISTPPEVAIEKFLNEAATLEHYGMEMYHVVDSNRDKMIVAVGPECILVLSSQMDVMHRYNFSAIHYTAFHARKFTAMVQPEDDSRPVQLEFELKSRAAAQALYRSVTEFHTFFQQDKITSVVKNAGYCKSIIGSFKGQSPDRFYFDVVRTHREVVDYLWPILNPNSRQSSRPRPPPLPSAGFPTTSMMSIASQRSTRSLPSHNPHSTRLQNSMQRSISTDNAFRRGHLPPPPPPFNPTDTPIHRPLPTSRRMAEPTLISHPVSSSSVRRVNEPTLRPPQSPFNPYASNIDYNTDSDDQSSTYISGGESDTYVCMRSTSGYIRTGSDSYTGSDTYAGAGSDTYAGAGSDTYAGAGSDTYINSGTSDISSSSIDRPPSPPPVYSEIDPNQDIPSPPPRPFALNPNNFTMTGILQNGSGDMSHEHSVFNFDTTEVLSRTRELETELQRLRSAMTCRICRTQPLGATFCPCGHTVCCYSCAMRLRQCWQCDEPIENVQKMLLA